MKNEKDISAFKLLGITILMTVSSCVSASGNVSAEQLSKWGVDLELSLNGNYELAKKGVKSNASSQESKIQRLINAGRKNFRGTHQWLLSSPALNIHPQLFHLPLLNKIVWSRSCTSFVTFYPTSSPVRAGPSAKYLS